MTGRLRRGDVVAGFDAATEWFLTVVARVGPDQWERPGLGAWSVRELVGHTGRALSTVEDYLWVPDPGAEIGPEPDSEADDDPVGAAASYFLGLRDNADLHRDVAERGRQAGAELPSGGNPAVLDALGILAERVRATVAGAPDDAVFKTRFGVQPFGAYLLTRTVELVVHSVDLAAACGSVFDVPAPAASSVVAVVGELAVRRGSAGELLSALGGRTSLRPDFGVFS
jgi:uncharacterized protein (TIGR03083 family)